MSRIPLLTLDDVESPTRDRLLAASRANGFLPNLLGLLAGAPAALEAYQTLSEINGRAGLTLAEREVVQITAAATHQCGFCVAGHTKLALLKAGLSEAEVEALRTLTPPDNPRYAALQIFTRDIIATRGRVSDGSLEAFRSAGYTNQAALEVVLGVGLATICNFANNLGDVPLNRELADFAWYPATARAAE